MSTRLTNKISSSPLFQNITPSEINQIDHTTGNNHYVRHSCRQALHLFTSIKEETQHPNLRVSVHLDEKDRICFTTTNTRTGNTTRRFIFNLSLLSNVENLLDTVITYAPKFISAVNNRRFAQKARLLYNKSCASAMSTEMTISECGNNYYFSTEQKGHFDTGIAHIVHVLDKLGRYSWFDPNTRPNKGEICACLDFYEQSHTIQLRLFSYDGGGNEVTQYRFKLIYGDQLKFTVESILKGCHKAEDELLLNTIRTYAASFAEEAA